MFRVLFLLALVYLALGEDTRAKRYSMIAIDRFSSGSCIVTGNKLFINSFYDHDLTSAEQTEFQQYQASVKTYTDQLTAYNKQQDEIYMKWQEQANNWWSDNARGGRKNRKRKATTTEAPTSTLAPPTPPNKPSFCSDEVTTQQYFNGCFVQHNKIYIGQNYARDLTSDEVTQLTTYNQQQKAYNEQWQNQWQNDYGFARPAIFIQRVSDTVAEDTSSSTKAPLVPPTQPNFCETIVQLYAPTPQNWDYGVDYVVDPEYYVDPAVDYGAVADSTGDGAPPVMDYPANNVEDYSVNNVADYSVNNVKDYDVKILPVFEDAGFAPQKDERVFKLIQTEPELTKEQADRDQAENNKIF